ncbi:MAG TPA: (Fe-S)-binding protein [Chromatiaceae bacterium]|nr:(Fe-S)-binding protein [Chromatiaceae bacterium]
MIPETARCVKCGLCLAECPTYRVSANEAQSPRGRINLVQALSEGQVEVDERSFELLDSCLLCRRCEAICPSGVPFGSILDQGLSLVRAQRGISSRLLVMVLSRTTLTRWLFRVGKAVLPSFLGLGKLLNQARPDVAEFESLYRPPDEEPAGRVGLFVGCTGQWFDSDALEGAISLLLQAGYEVHIPRNQGCCGALDAHAGNSGRAQRLTATNEAAFAASGDLDAILSIASGCGAQLAVYKGIGPKHEDVATFLASEAVMSRLRFKPLPKIAAVHIPCTLENVLRGREGVLRLLDQVPGLQIEVLGRKGACCGAGGADFLLRRDRADQLREPFAEQIDVFEPDYVLSGNVSCRLHLQAGAANPEYLHPLTLLARQLIRG